MTGVLDDYMVDPSLSFLDKTRIQAQVLVPVLRALRAELGKDKADAIVKQALRDWSKQMFAAIGEGVDQNFAEQNYASDGLARGDGEFRKIDFRFFEHPSLRKSNICTNAKVF